MKEASLKWIGVLGVVTIIIPVLLYGITGIVLGFLIPCNEGAGILAVSYGTDDLVLGCQLVNTAISLGVTIWGTALVVGGGFILAIADIVAEDSSRTNW